jgi:hypothetical protein
VSSSATEHVPELSSSVWVEPIDNDQN